MTDRIESKPALAPKAKPAGKKPTKQTPRWRLALRSHAGHLARKANKEKYR